MSFRKDERHEALYQLPADLEATPETFSHLFLPDIYVETVAKHSASYAKMRNGSSARPILPTDILHFFAIFYLMGIVRLPCKEDYWKTNGRVNIGMLNEYGYYRANEGICIKCWICRAGIVIHSYRAYIR